MGTNQLDKVVGQTVYDGDNKKIGTASDLYTSDQSRTPEWVTVRTGMFGNKDSFVPLAGATTDESGLHVSPRKDTIKGAPRVPDDGEINDQEVRDLYRHYGMRTGGAPNGQQPGQGQGQGRTAADQSAGGAPAAGAPAAGAGTTPGTEERPTTSRGQPQGDESMVRSEERLRTGTEAAETGRVRLRKHVVTEEQQVTVPVQHEEVHVTREPVSPDDTTARGGELGDEEREVVVHEERPVVSKETVPVERVGLDTETVQEDQQVTETVRKEQVDVDDTASGGRHENRGSSGSGTR
ncbi:MAG: DUF2382 domain-containing protein [Streptosporangiales bacterium]